MKILLIFTLTLSLNLSCGNEKSVGRQDYQQQQATGIVKNDRHADTGYQTVKKYGFQFQIPDNWQLQMNDFKTKNLKGDLKTIETSYVDNVNNSHIRLVYHPGNSGLTLYRYYADNNPEKTGKTKIGQSDAIKRDEILTRDGKGHLLSKPVIRHKIYVVAPGQKGVLEIVYDLPKDDDKAGEVYNNFIKGIKSIE